MVTSCESWGHRKERRSGRRPSDKRTHGHTHTHTHTHTHLTHAHRRTHTHALSLSPSLLRPPPGLCSSLTPRGSKSDRPVTDPKRRRCCDGASSRRASPSPTYLGARLTWPTPLPSPQTACDLIVAAVTCYLLYALLTLLLSYRRKRANHVKGIAKQRAVRLHKDAVRARRPRAPWANANRMTLRSGCMTLFKRGQRGKGDRCRAVVGSTLAPHAKHVTAVVHGTCP